ncbi:hypothetical protein PsYK624_103070 [Phanerochaete sordida]|uniref:Six-hairpin glycosidase n=1 Tax=Phanerochaete sordida TaxID=48140 RepID=A0A9P3GH08_9APHY|nr:hypothetical protein PsYK624_103070 [Phanerochaete sordida]
MHARFPHIALASLLVASPFVQASSPNLTSSQTDAIKAGLSASDLQSWEIGTFAEALLELDTPSWSPQTPGVQFASFLTSSPPSSLDEVFTLAKNVTQDWTNTNKVNSSNTSVVAAPLLTNSAAGDPPSTGFAVILANITGRAQQDNLQYAEAATSQLEYLLTRVPKTSDGAISHRPEQLQLWSDYVYMVPPFLAYYGAATGNDTVLRMAHDQIRLYRQYLQNNSSSSGKGPSTAGLWRHMALGNGPDEGFWSTGNAWAAAGIVRVLGIYASSTQNSSLQTEQADLVEWAHEIHGALGPWLDGKTSLLHNYADNSSEFLDAASSTLFAASVYRLATLAAAGIPPASAKSSAGTSVGDLVPRVESSVPAAERVRVALFTNSSGSTGSGLAHFTADMTLMPVVNPHNFGAQLQLPVDASNASLNDGLTRSPEAQAFVLELQAAYRDWTAGGSPERSAAGAVGVQRGVLVAALAVAVGAALF